MQVKINGKVEEFPGGSILDLLKTKKIEPQMVAVEINDSMVEREHLGATQLKEGDRLEFLFYMGGGI
jgi:sulfur carrier protein